ncbi:germinal-center associated nuclear protein [Hippocampus zosterae]|uniref:germinal-center associated nuclear protein n=1 Tax=Hippocampus zosterae TaxID=109293 RepID=UPI00223D7D0C|nr:germinal-center associated nuclear protein [Hippocampus zosterae]XP_051925939.1 germinal-center associated nuclear protein [Hippocampus zosterae]XP_051925940.1 germinal-center associated nuclear protein [Hippocampus zosterae]
MNPSNPFGSPRGGVFQATSNANAGLFQSFGQQAPSSLPQNVGMFQSSAFGLPPASQLPMLGQRPSFGQPSPQASSLPSHTPAFSQTTVGASNSGFGSPAAPAFGSVGGPSQTSAFGQTPAFGPQSVFGQEPSFGRPSSGFGQKLAGFGQQAAGFGNTQSASVASLGPPRQLGFGQSVFGQAPTTAATSNVFGATQTQSRGFGSEFSFKPASEVLFKPIYSGSPEPPNPQTTPLSGSPFGSTAEKTSSSPAGRSSTITGFSGPSSGSLAFSFSQPAAVPSLPVPNGPQTTLNNSGGPPRALQFTFSQPAAPSGSNPSASTTQPKAPSAFSFSTQTLSPQTMQLFGGTAVVQPSAFADNKSKAEPNLETKTPEDADANVFAQLRKGMKRKEEPATTNVSAAGPEAIAKEEETAETSSTRQPPKRPLMRARAPVGLFSRALSGLRRAAANPGDKEAEEPPQEKPEEVTREHPQVLGEKLTVLQALSPQLLQKDEESDPQELMAETKTPLRPGARRKSSNGPSGTSPADCTVIQCKNMPPALNKRDVIEKHFSRFGKVCKVFCRPAKNTAIVHFNNHASAAKAKKNGKVLHQHELILLWQRKKQSPGDESRRPPARKMVEDATNPDRANVKASSPLKRPVLSSAFTRRSPMKKSPIGKSLRLDFELQKENVATTLSSKCLAPLIGVVAETSEDKYRLLEQRDRIVRQGRSKTTDIYTSKVFVGTCPDMCPEKERYMRETRNQLSIYEVLPDTEMVDHAAAIKEYSRSSADQEEPLPHELRPLPVLSMTMDYLVTQIMDQGNDSLRDWYDFVWNRTRGIRKDITQQHLCCPQTVALIEKCTRFHLHCAHHLCEEPMSVYDAKINNENLTKCLQSLKEMYQDLNECHTYCPREAEFRQYSVLLKLNDGDILREVQQFRDQVRNSPEVHFAVQAFAALNSNNFVRFFKLVKRASYLAGCLLHRYFNQVRGKALKTLTFAHTVGPRSTAFPLEDIVRLLMFRSAIEASAFIQQYGLSISDGAVELNRIAYQEPELLSQKKSEVIQAKKTLSTGEVVNGGPLPNPPRHQPVCTFDSHNKYRAEGPPQAEPAAKQLKAIAATVEVKTPPSLQFQAEVSPIGRPDVPNVYGLRPAVAEKTQSADSFQSSAFRTDAPQPVQPAARPPPVKAPSPAPEPRLVFSDADITAEVDRLIDEMVETTARAVAADGVCYASIALSESCLQAESIANEVLGELLQELSSSEIHLEQKRVAEEKRKLEEARRKQEHADFLATFRLSLFSEILQQVLEETIKETAATVLQEAVDERARCVAKCSQEVCTSLIEETLKADVALLVEEILAAELQRARKYIKRWRDVVAVRRQLRRQMRGFPAAPCFVDPRLRLKALAPSAPAQQSREDLICGLVNLGNAGRLSLSSTRVLEMRHLAVHQMRVQYYYRQLLDEKVWAPLDVPALVMANLHNPPDRIFWKAVVLLPCDHESVGSLADRILSDWLEAKLAGSPGSKLTEEQRDGTLRTLHLSNEMREIRHQVHVSIKVSRGPLSAAALSQTEERRELQGTSALIMLLPALAFLEARGDERDVPLLSALLQLKQLQQASAWHRPPPLVVLVPGSDRGGRDIQNLEEELMLPLLVKDGLIAEYTLMFIPETTDDMQGTKQLGCAIRWLLRRAPPPVPLRCRPLAQLVEATLSREFSRRLCARRQESGVGAPPWPDPAPVVALYNAVIGHVADHVSSEELSKISWPPAEFCLPDNGAFVPRLGWNAGPHLAWLRETVLNLRLPQWKRLSSSDAWSEMCSAVYGYADQMRVSRGSRALLLSRLENLLERVRMEGQRRQTRASKNVWDDTRDANPARSEIPWVDVLVICIDHKLKDWPLSRQPVCEDAVTEDGEILVYYLDEAFERFQPPEEWIEAVGTTTRGHKRRDDKRASLAPCTTPNNLTIRQRLYPSAPEAPVDISDTPTAIEALAHKVFLTLEEEKAESRRSTQLLRRWLDGGDCAGKWFTPLLIPSSVMLSVPAFLERRPPAKPLDAVFAKEARSPQPAEKDKLTQRSRLSVTERLRDLQQQIEASQKEESACKLTLSAMMSIVED